MFHEKKIFILLIIFVLVLLTTVFIFRSATLSNELSTVQAELQKEKINKNVLKFTRIFIESVLRAKQEVSFEERLRLETMVRDLKDNQILAQWNTFVNSKNETQAQEGVKDLLSLLMQKLK